MQFLEIRNDKTERKNRLINRMKNEKLKDL
ncbi:hypothetical protein LCGC14_1734290 [marine sediment metagenome]|uniref:Uncharacterized protein n=1 Tax=marine sediment metagenome TaxID=412755 RepID=A0A0F9JP14_9ZZZZ